MQIEECGFALQAQNIRSQWFVDSEGSNHMTGDKNRFLSLNKEKEGSSMFGNDHAPKILGKGMVSLGTKLVW